MHCEWCLLEQGVILTAFLMMHLHLCQLALC